MKVKCSVINDLLPLYVDDLCCDDTKEMIEEHIKTCTECKAKLERMQTPVLHEAEEPVSVNKSFEAKKVMKKVKNRWLKIFVSIIVVIPLLYLTINQVRGEGIRYTSFPKIIEVNQFLSAIEDRDYEKAYSYLSIRPLYDDYISIDTTGSSLKQYIAQHKEAKIGDDIYYLKDDIYLDYYVAYLETKDEVQFWYDVFLYDESVDYPAIAFSQEIMQKVMDIHSEVKEMLDEKYVIQEGKNLNYYIKRYYSVADIAYNGASLIPNDYFKEEIEINAEAEDLSEEIVTYYTNLGYDGYYEASKKTFIENLQSLANKGITLKGHRFVNMTAIDDKIQLTYSIKLSYNGEELDGNYIYVICDDEGVRSIAHSATENELVDEFSLIKLKGLD